MKRHFCAIALMISCCYSTSYAEESNPTTENQRQRPMSLSSPAFSHEGSIPAKYTCDDKSISPPLTIQNIPTNAKSLMLIAVDKEAALPPDQDVIWFVYNISPQIKTIQENQIPSRALIGQNSDGSHSYHGLCPKDVGLHHYYFSLYALDIVLPNNIVTLREASTIMQDHMVGYASLSGTYARR